MHQRNGGLFETDFEELDCAKATETSLLSIGRLIDGEISLVGFVSPVNSRASSSAMTQKIKSNLDLAKWT